MPPFRTAKDDLFDDMVAEARAQTDLSRQRSAVSSIAQPAKPETVGKANKLGRRLNMPPVVVEQDLHAYETLSRMYEARETAKRDPIAGEFLSNPRNAAVAQEDLDTGVLTRIGDLFSSVASGAVQGAGTALRGAGALLDIAQRRSPVDPTAVIFGGPTGLLREITDEILERSARGAGMGAAADQLQAGRTSRRQGRQVAVAGARQAGRNIQEAGRSIDVPEERKNLATDIAGAVGQIAFQIAGTLATGGAGGAAILVSQGAGAMEERSEAAGKEETIASDVAIVGGGAVTGVTEKIGLDRVLKVMPKGVRNQLGDRLLDVFQAGGTEALTEVAEGVATNLIEKGLLDPNAEVLTGETAYEGGVAGAAAMIVRTVLGGRRAQDALADRAGDSVQAKLEGEFADSVMGLAEQSKLRERDPEAFRDLMRRYVEGKDAENLYIPAEAARVLYQTDDSGFFGGMADEISEAEAVGGDVIVPLADAAARMSPQEWESVREQVRFSPGGQSRAEARTFDEAMADELAALETEFTAELKAEDEARAPRQRVFDSTLSRLRSAGQSLDEARTNAEYFTESRMAWAQRMGWSPEDERLQVEVRSVLPGQIAEFRAADEIDVLVETARKGRSGDVDRGPSLAQWIADRGGIEDPGGDLASMGANAWHVGKPGQRKLVRQSVKGQGSFLQSTGNDNSPDAMAFAAWEAGFFPEFTERPAINDLLDALGEEVNGRGSRFSEELAKGDDETQNRRRAAEELESLLGQRGLDILEASREEIDAALDEFAQEQAAGRGFEQSFNEGIRGRAAFGEGRPIIELFQQRNLSTFLHEMGHVHLENLRQFAAEPDAPADVKSDWQTVVTWLVENGVGPGEDGEIPVEGHELWARGHERYLMEGKAPSVALRGAFQRFKAWLLRIYEVVANLNSPISDEIRAVMDRLLATGEQIAEARETQKLEASFTDAAAAGMTAAEFSAYQRLTQSARDEGESQMLFRTMAAIRKSRTEEWKEREREVRPETVEALDQEPPFRALKAIRDDAALRLDRGWLVEHYGADALTLIPGNVPPLYKEAGANPDIVAERLGFESGETMVNALMGLGRQKQALVEAGDKRSPRAFEIDKRTEAAMLERYGDVLSDGSIEEEALAAVHNEKAGELLATELRVLGRQTNRQATPYRAAKEWARRKIGEGEVRAVASKGAIQQYTRAARKAANAAEQAILAGDRDEAFRQKQAQMLQNALVGEAKRQNEAIEKAVNRLGKVAAKRTVKSIDQEYLEQAHSLLERYEFKKVSQARLNEREEFAAWKAAREAEGYDVVVPERLMLGRTNWSRMSVDDLLALDESVKQILHIGRTKQGLLDDKEEREFEEVISAALDGINNNLRKTPPGDLTQPGRFEAAWQRAVDMEAALLKAEEIFDWLDGGDANGIFNRHVFRPIASAQDAEKARLQEVHERLGEHLKALPKDTPSRWLQRVDLTSRLGLTKAGEQAIFTRDQLIAMALNTGNEGNLAKLAGGYGFEANAILEALNAELTAEEWAYVQNVWDTIDSLWPDIEALERRVNGVAPEKVEPREVETPFGTLRGGYFPVVYDPSRNYSAERHAADDARLFEGGYTRATTRAGSTRERTNVERPILLHLAVVQRHVAEVVHDITHREPVMQAWRFLSDPRIMSAIDETLGAAKRKQLLPWVQHVANEWAQDRRGATALNAFFRKLRTNATMVGLGFRFSTMLLQVAGYANSAERVGARWLGPAMQRFARDPIGMSNFALERSGELRNRMSTLDRDIRDSVRAAAGNDKAVSEVKRFAFLGIGYMDRAVSVPTWHAAYSKAIAAGADEELAIYEGDKAIRQSQGAGAAKDLAAVQRPQHEILKWATMFYSYMSAFYQRQRRLGRDVISAVQDRDVERVPELLARGWWLLIMPTVIESLLPGRGPEDDEDPAAWAATQIFLANVGPIPIVRDVMSSAIEGWTYEFSPAQGGPAGLVRLADDVIDVAQGEDASKRWLQNALETAGFFTGLVPGQVAASSQFILDVMEGDQDPETVGDWYEGITKGRIKDD